MLKTKSIIYQKAEGEEDDEEVKQKRRVWHELSYEEAVFAGFEHYKKLGDTLKRTNIMMPQTLRIELEQLKSKWDYPQRYLIYQLVYHGHSIVEHTYMRQIRKIRKLRDSMGQPKIQRIKDFIYDMRTIVNGLATPKPREVRATPAILSSFGEMESSLSIEQSSLMRLCIYYSILTYSDVTLEIQEVAQNEIKKFARYVGESEVLYKGFKLAEDEIAKKQTFYMESIDQEKTNAE